MESLTRHRTAALSAALIKRPEIALAATVHAIASSVFCGEASKSCVQVSIRRHSFSGIEGCPAEAAIKAEQDRWSGILPGTPEKLWAWCVAQETQTLIELLTFCAANAVDAVIRKRGSMDFGTSMEHAGMLAKALDLDMTQWFTPTAANYFSHVSKAHILDALQEAKGQPAAPAWEKAKKAELAVIAERQTAGTGWLPDILRGPAKAR